MHTCQRAVCPQADAPLSCPQDWFGWSDTAANLLFTAAGVVTLVCAVAMSSLSSVVVQPDGTKTQRVDDRVMLIASFALALLGWLVLVPPDGWGAGGSSMGVGQFLVGFALVTIAFPFGRGVASAIAPPSCTPRGLRRRPHCLPSQPFATLVCPVADHALAGLCLAMVGKLLGDQPQGCASAE